MRVLAHKINRTLLFLLIATVTLSPYLSSWAPMLQGLPIGPIIRAIILLFVYSVFFIIVIYNNRLSYKKLTSLYILYMLTLVYGVIISDSSMLQVMLGLHSILIYPAFFYLLLIYYSTAPKWVSYKIYVSSITFLTYMFFILSIVAILDVFTGGIFTLLLGYNPNYGGENFSLIIRYGDLVRANAGVTDALAFGYLMAVGVVFFLYKISSYSKDVFSILTLFLVSFSLLLTYTRGAILCLMIIVVMKSIQSKKGIVFLFLTFFVVSSFLFIGYGDVYIERFTDSSEASSTSTMMRLFMAIASLEFLAENPFGMGLGTQGAGNTLTVDDQRINTDNFIFHVFLETGLISGVVFFMLMLSQFKLVFSHKNIVQYARYMLIIFLICILFSSSIQSALLSLTFWWVLFIIYIGSGFSNARIYN